MTKAETHQTLLQRALGLQQAGRLAEAEPLYREVLRLAPAQPDALHLLGLLCKDTGRTAEAEALMRRALKLAPRQPQLHNNLGNLLGNLGRRTEAFDHYRAAIALAPDYADAWRNLGLTLIDDARAAEAVPLLETAARLAPGHSETLLGLGIALNQSGDPGRALSAFQAVLAQQPEHARALHNLGVALDLQGDFKAAADAFEKAAAADPDRAETQLSLGNAYSRLDGADKAAAAYRRAVELAPGYREAHQNLSKLLWRNGAGADFLSSYPPAIARAPGTPEIRVDYAGFLLQSGRHGPAEEVLKDALAIFPNDASLWRLRGRALSNLRRQDAARTAFRKACECGPASVEAHNDLARFLIAAGEYDAALEALAAAESLSPLDQQLWAYRSLCWRLMGDPRAEWLDDIERFIRPIRLRLPDGHGSPAVFNLALKGELERLHRTKVHPIDQSLTGGTQTEGSLFAEKSPVIAAFRDSLKVSIADYIESLPEGAGHPFLGRKSKNFSFAGSWSVRLRDGHHLNHIHPEGWISSAYYVSLPQTIKAAGDGRAGWIKFGESNLGLGDREAITRMIQPEEGLLVLFPSYMWHGTMPFAGDSERLTIAFDVVPG